MPRALAAQIAILKDASTPRDKRDEALRFVVHFVGDMHQPLHVGERGDQGGNKVQVTLIDHPTNLHSAWDSGLLKLWFQADPAAHAALDEGAAPADRAALAAGSIDDWIWETQAVAAKSVYGPLDACQCATLDAAYLAQASGHEVATAARRRAARSRVERNAGPVAFALRTRNEIGLPVGCGAGTQCPFPHRDGSGRFRAAFPTGVSEPRPQGSGGSVASRYS